MIENFWFDEYISNRLEYREPLVMTPAGPLSEESWVLSKFSLQSLCLVVSPDNSNVIKRRWYVWKLFNYYRPWEMDCESLGRGGNKITIGMLPYRYPSHVATCYWQEGDELIFLSPQLWRIQQAVRKFIQRMRWLRQMRLAFASCMQNSILTPDLVELICERCKDGV